MKKFIRLIQLLLKSLYRNRSEKTFIDNNNNNSYIYEKRQDVVYNVYPANIYTSNDKKLLEVFNSVYKSSDILNKQEQLVFIMIKHDIKLDEVNRYINKGKVRYFQRLEVLYPDPKVRLELCNEQKFEVLKGFRIAPVNENQCFLNFLTVSKKDEMLIAFEFDQSLTQKYNWFVDFLKGSNKIKQAWYLIKYHLQKSFSFIPNSFEYHSCISSLQEKKYLKIIEFPDKELFTNYLPFSIIKKRFLQLNINVRNRQEAHKKMNEINFNPFNKEDTNELSGYFVETLPAINEFKTDFDKVINFYYLISKYI